MQKDRRNSRILPSLDEKRYYTLNFLESAVMGGSPVDITTVVNKDITDLSGEKFTYSSTKLSTYIIFDERPKVNLLKTLGWYREDGPVPVLAYIPTHLLYKKEIVEVEPEVFETTYTVANYDVLNGTELKQLVKTGESDNFKLVPLKIIRGTLIDIKYDFLPKLANGDDDPLGITNRFFAADSKVDTVSMNYIVNLMPYRYDIPKPTEEENEDINSQYIDFDTSKFGI